MREIGAFEAKNRLSELLDAVVAGEEITITRRGKPVAKIVRHDASGRERALEAIERVTKLREKFILGDDATVRDLIDDGRRVMLVLDGSLALAWCFHDETTPEVDSVMEQVALAGAIVPAIRPLEVANGLRSAIRRGRLAQQDRDKLLSALRDVIIESDPDTARFAWSATLRLADRHGLTPYGAS